MKLGLEGLLVERALALEVLDEVVAFVEVLFGCRTEIETAGVFIERVVGHTVLFLLFGGAEC